MRTERTTRNDLSYLIIWYWLDNWDYVVRNVHKLQLTVSAIMGRHPRERPAAESHITGASLRAVPGDQRVVWPITVDSFGSWRVFDEMTDDEVAWLASALQQKPADPILRWHRHYNETNTYCIRISSDLEDVLVITTVAAHFHTYANIHSAWSTSCFIDHLLTSTGVFNRESGDDSNFGHLMRYQNAPNMS